MSPDFPLLSWLIWLPIVGGIATLALGDGRIRWAQWVALLSAVGTLGLSLPLWTHFDTTTALAQFVERASWIPTINAWYRRVYDTTLAFALVTRETVLIGLALALVLGLAAGLVAALRLTSVDALEEVGR